jgi:hypothetical protein
MMKRASITIKSELLQTVDERAHAEGTNRSQYITKALEAFTSGQMTADVMPYDGPDATQDTTITLLKREVLHKDELLKDRDQLIGLYQAILGGRATQLPRVEPIKVGFWRRVFGRKKKDETI